MATPKSKKSVSEEEVSHAKDPETIEIKPEEFNDVEFHVDVKGFEKADEDLPETKEVGDYKAPAIDDQPFKGADPDVNYHNPFKNPNAISLVRQPDGNWKGWMSKFDKVIEVREIGPDTALQMLLTHE